VRALSKEWVVAPGGAEEERNACPNCPTFSTFLGIRWAEVDFPCVGFAHAGIAGPPRTCRHEATLGR
jgi:hypothetical protein